MLRTLAACLLILLTACNAPSSGSGQSAASAALPELKITVFAAPSQSLWLPVLIRALKLDEKQGFKLTVTPKPGPVAYTEFATGADPVCYCAAPSAVARFVEQGADITLLWNIFNLDYFVVTTDPAIKSIGDIAGKNVGADTSTGSWSVAAWLLQQNGVNLDAVHIQSSSSAPMMTALSVGRLDAAVFGLIETASLTTADGGDRYRILGLNRTSIWEKYGSSRGIPSIAFGVWRSWLAEGDHRELAKKLYRANLDAAAYIRSDPDRAAELISAETSMSKKALLYLFKNDAPMIDIRPISEYRASIKLLTQDLLPAAHQLDRPLTDTELNNYVSDFQP